MKITDNIKIVFLIHLSLMSYKINAQLNLESQKDSIVNFYDISHIFEIDSSLQIKNQDSINLVKSKIKGLWHYQGKLENKKLIADTELVA